MTTMTPRSSVSKITKSALTSIVLPTRYQLEDRRKALFLTRIGQATFAKLKTVVIPQPLTELTLDTIVQTLATHYWLDTVEIAECYKFIKR